MTITPTARTAVAAFALLAAVALAGCGSSTTSGRQASPTDTPASTAPSSSEPSSTTGGGTDSVPSSAAPVTSQTGSAPASTVTCTYTANGSTASPKLPPTTPRSATSLQLTMNVHGKAAGAIAITMTPSTTPCTVNSIAFLARSQFYDNTKCHRLTTSGIYVLQCGDPTGTGTGGPGYSFPDELSGNETYPAGTVAMANAGPNTNGSQFFLVYRDSQLGPDYTVFGRITGGMSVLDGIAAAGTAQAAGDGTPKYPVVITKATAS